MAAVDKYISGILDFTKQLPTLSDIWSGDSVYEYSGFLSDDHVSDILDRVMSDWTRAYPFVEEKHTGEPYYCIRCLGQNFWSLPPHPDYDDHFDPELRSYMLQEYRDINEYLENFCRDYLNKTPEYVPGIATPGFNIVTSDLVGTYWHTDGALIRKIPDIDVKKIISVNIPIQCDKQSHTEFRLGESAWPYKARLVPGSMLIWPGRKIHRFGCQTIQDDHYRITYQAHIYDAGDRALIYF